MNDKEIDEAVVQKIKEIAIIKLIESTDFTNIPTNVQLEVTLTDLRNVEINGDITI